MSFLSLTIERILSDSLSHTKGIRRHWLSLVMGTTLPLSISSKLIFSLSLQATPREISRGSWENQEEMRDVTHETIHSCKAGWHLWKFKSLGSSGLFNIIYWFAFVSLNGRRIWLTAKFSTRESVKRILPNKHRRMKSQRREGMDDGLQNWKITYISLKPTQPYKQVNKVKFILDIRPLL